LGSGLVASQEPRRLTPAELDAEHPAWMPDSSEILFSTPPRIGSALYRLVISGEGSPARLPFVGEDGQTPAVSRSAGGMARLVYVRSFQDPNIWRVEIPAPGGSATSPPVVAISSTRMDIVGDFAPSGRRVAFSSNRSGKHEIWLADPDGSNTVQLTSTSTGVLGAPRWSPDGGSIAFQSNFEGQFEIYVIPASGGKLHRITSHPASDHVPAFSRDGKWIYFSSNRTGNWQIWKIGATGGDAVQVTPNSGFGASESLDGAYLYYASEYAPGSEISLWRIPTSGGQPVKLLEGELSEGFAVLQEGIYFVESLSGEACIRFFDFGAGTSMTVARNLGAVRPLLTATRDGRTILYTRLDSSGDDLMLVENFR
jgi:Tol biopolymer transport system component